MPETRETNHMGRAQAVAAAAIGVGMIVCGVMLFDMEVAGPAAIAAGVMAIAGAALVLANQPAAAVLALLAAVAVGAVAAVYAAMGGAH